MTGNIIEPVAALFLFVNFPLVVKLFERKKEIKTLFTNVIDIYFCIVCPIVSIFLIYSKEIVHYLLPNTYNQVAYVLPLFAIISLLHELIKLVNFKYHLKNTTYIETSILLFVISSILFINNILYIKTTVYNSVLIVLYANLFILMINCLVRFKNFEYIKYRRVLKNLGTVLISSVLSLLLVAYLPTNTISLCTVKIIMYLVINYMLIYFAKTKINFLKN